MVTHTISTLRRASPTELNPALPIVVNTLQGVESMVRRFMQFSPETPLAFDTETTGLDPRKDKLVMLIFKPDRRPAVVVDVRHWYTQKTAVGMLLQPLFERFLVVGHNLSFDYSFMKLHMGVELKRVWDTQIAEQVYYGVGLSDARNQEIGLSLKECAKRRGIEMSKEERNWFIDLDKRPEWNQGFPGEQLRYAARDVEVPLLIYQDQLQKLQAKAECYEVDVLACAELEMQVLPCKSEVELVGVLIDQGKWREVLAEEERKAKALEEELHGRLDTAILQARAERFDEVHTGYTSWEDARDLYLESLRARWNAYHVEEQLPGWGEYKNGMMRVWREENPNPGKPKPDTSIPNLSSVPQLMDAFRVLGIPARNTSSDTLKLFEDDHPIIACLLEWRKAKKFGESFGENLLEKINPETGLIYPHINQIGASSNRMSAVSPNLQQIPARSETGKKMRRCFIAPPGMKLLTADFSSQELCILADLSGDETMLRFFEEGADLHAETARMMFGLGPEVNTKQHEVAPGVSARDAAKTINYGIAYGMTKFRLSRLLGCSTARAQDLIDAWYETYPGVRRFLLSAAKLAVEKHYSYTLHGWIRHYKPLPPEPTKPFNKGRDAYQEWKNDMRAWEKLKGALENKGMNTPIQGLGAGITKRALVNFCRSLKLDNESMVSPTEGRIDHTVGVVLVVHDELVVQVNARSAEAVAEKLARSMDEAMAYYLHRVKVPHSQVNIADWWGH